jgi:hypothetical protein
MNQNNFAESMLKGRMAESLIEELLRKSGNTIYRFGYEAILQHLSQIKQNFDANTEAGKRIRSIPDFIVIDVNGNPIFIEVKFRWNGQPHFDDRVRFERIKSFWSAKIIFVNCVQKPYFRISSPPYFNKAGKFMSLPLRDETAWKIDPNVYEEFESLVEKYLTPTLVAKKDTVKETEV